MNAKLVYARALASTWYTTDTYTDRTAAVGQAFLDDLLRLLLMRRVHALYESHRLTQNGDVTFHYTVNHLGYCHFAAAKTTTL